MKIHSSYDLNILEIYLTSRGPLKEKPARTWLCSIGDYCQRKDTATKKFIGGALIVL